MHPGWKLFMQGFMSGMLVMFAMIAAARNELTVACVFGALWVVVFLFGGRNAENLMTRPLPNGEL